MLDHLSNGRMELGISRGVSPYEIANYSVDPEKTREIFTEVLEIFRQGMCNEVLNYTGQHFEFRDVPMPLKPVQAPYPPLWYPSFSEDGVEFAAREGMHFMTLGPPSLVTNLMARYRAVAADSGPGDTGTLKLGRHASNLCGGDRRTSLCGGEAGVRGLVPLHPAAVASAQRSRLRQLFRLGLLPGGRNDTDRLGRHSPRANPALGLGEWDQLFRRLVRLGLIESAGKPQIARSVYASHIVPHIH